LIIVPGCCVLALVACSGSPAQTAASSTGRAAGRPSHSSHPSPAASAPRSDITLAFAGDVHFTGRTAALLADPATAFGPIASVLRSADFTAVNL
jgi:poly-gamma-glutamate synthesis protein (capsule biosynthesis protein)